MNTPPVTSTHRTMKLTLDLSTYATEEQNNQIIDNIVHELQLRGYNVALSEVWDSSELS